jgi:hypothetical protein
LYVVLLTNTNEKSLGVIWSIEVLKKFRDDLVNRGSKKGLGVIWSIEVLKMFRGDLVNRGSKNV